MNNETFEAGFRPSLKDPICKRYPLALPDHNLYFGAIVGTCTGRMTVAAKFKDEKYLQR